MRAISVGDVFFLESPFHDRGGDTELEKRLSYLLGTASSRPAVVIRPPEWWDQFNTCTIIPGLSKGYPCYTVHMYDRYGARTSTDYHFIPHNPHTIPVARLGRYIGRLEDDELEGLLYAHKWIHDIYMQRDPSCKVPGIYEIVNKKSPIGSWKKNHDARSNVVLRLNDKKIESDTHPEMNGFDVSSALQMEIPRDTDIALKRESNFVPVETVLPDSVEVKENEVAVPVEKKFPKSIFDTDTLMRVAGRFNISEVYYTDMVKRNPDILTESEMTRIRQDKVKQYDIMMLLDYYKKMEPLDAYLLGPRLPLKILAEITKLSIPEAAALKRMCNIMRDISTEEYERRIAEKFPPTDEEPPADDLPWIDNDPDDPKKQEEEDMDKMIEMLRPYMNKNRVDKLPKHLHAAFAGMPEYVIKRIWSGPNFRSAYESAMKKYRWKKVSS